MPIFEYECEECDRTFQELVRDPRSGAKGSDGNGVACLHCGSPRVLRLFSSFSTGTGSQAGRGEKRRESPWSGDSFSGGSCGCGSSCGCR